MHAVHVWLLLNRNGLTSGPYRKTFSRNGGTDCPYINTFSRNGVAVVVGEDALLTRGWGLFAMEQFVHIRRPLLARGHQAVKEIVAVTY